MIAPPPDSPLPRSTPWLSTPQVHPLTFTRGGREPMGNRVTGVAELGSVVYSALDYR